MTGAPGVDLGQVLSQLAEGVAVVDPAGRIRYANPEALRLLGRSDRLPREWRGLLLAGERFDDVDLQVAGDDGVARTVRCAGGPLALEDGQAGAWISFRDIGREETILRELREERDLVTALVDLSPLAVAVARAPDLVIELASDVARSLAPGVRMVGTELGEVFPQAGAARLLDQVREVAATGRAVSVEDAPLDWWEPGR